MKHQNVLKGVLGVSTLLLAAGISHADQKVFTVVVEPQPAAPIAIDGLSTQDNYMDSVIAADTTIVQRTIASNVVTTTPEYVAVTEVAPMPATVVQSSEVVTTQAPTVVEYTPVQESTVVQQRTVRTTTTPVYTTPVYTSRRVTTTSTVAAKPAKKVMYGSTAKKVVYRSYAKTGG